MRRTKAEIAARHDAMVEMWSAGHSMRAVARAFGVDHKTVDYALSRRAGQIPMFGGVK